MVEMLAAIAILLILVMLVSKFTGFAFNAISESKKRVDSQSKARAALNLIARDIESSIIRSDLPSFTDGAGHPTLAFYTSHLGLTDAADSVSLYRPLSFVIYQTQENATGLASLRRGVISVKWARNESYPTVGGTNTLAFQSESNLVPLIQTATSSPVAYQDLIDGVIRLEIGFLYKDGSVTALFDNTSGASKPKAIIVTILVVSDARMMTMLKASGKLETFKLRFNGSASVLPERVAVTDLSLKTRWNAVLNTPTTWDGLPKEMATGLRCYERVIYLQ